MTYKDNDRYQFQPWYIKFYRHLKYRPLWYYSVAKCYIKWILRGAPKEDWHTSRWQTAAQSMDIWRGLYDCWIGHYRSAEEIMEELSNGF